MTAIRAMGHYCTETPKWHQWLHAGRPRPHGKHQPSNGVVRFRNLLVFPAPVSGPLGVPHPTGLARTRASTRAGLTSPTIGALPALRRRVTAGCSRLVCCRRGSCCRQGLSPVSDRAGAREANAFCLGLCLPALPLCAKCTPRKKSARAARNMGHTVGQQICLSQLFATSLGIIHVMLVCVCLELANV